MLIFESLSAGSISVLLLLVASLVAVGVYALLIWPLTKWTLAANAAQYFVWWQAALWLIFIVGTAAGFWYFSGSAFEVAPAPRPKVEPQALPQNPGPAASSK
jgi:hypothetical protein